MAYSRRIHCKAPQSQTSGNHMHCAHSFLPLPPIRCNTARVPLVWLRLHLGPGRAEHDQASSAKRTFRVELAPTLSRELSNFGPFCANSGHYRAEHARSRPQSVETKPISSNIGPNLTEDKHMLQKSGPHRSHTPCADSKQLWPNYGQFWSDVGPTN